MLLGSRCGKEGVLLEEAAARMKVAETKGLPETYIDVGESGLSRDGDIEYAKKMYFGGYKHRAACLAWRAACLGGNVSWCRGVEEGYGE